MGTVEPENTARFAAAPVVWIHAADCANFSGVEYLCLRMLLAHPDLYIVLTGAVDRAETMAQQERIFAIEMPYDGYAIDRFFQKFDPNYCLWSGGELHPPLLKAAALRKIEMLLVDAVQEGFKGRRFRFLPNVKARALRRFSDFYAVDAPAAQQLARLGVTASRIQVKGALQQSVIAARASHDILETKLYAHLATRPVWLAADVSKAEMKTVLSAQRLVLRHAHRMLLILASQQDQESAAILKICEDLGLNAGKSSERDLPEANTQVLIVNEIDEMDLWYRLASVCFLGQSLAPQAPTPNPYQAATLGCAIVHGPSLSEHEDKFLRLADAGAARQIRDSDTLATAVWQISAPEVAAQMAFAAWQATSDGAELTDAVIARVLEHLDELGI